MKNDQKIKSSKMLATLLLCSGLVGAGSAFSQELTADGKVRCTIATAENMSSVRDLCNCQVVTPGMLGYLRRQDDFGEILDRFRCSKKASAFLGSVLVRSINVSMYGDILSSNLIC